MSSTNRSDSRNNHKNDYYVTPVDKIKLFLEMIDFDENIFKSENMKILDPCAGGIVNSEKEFYNHMPYIDAIEFYKTPFMKIDSIDIRMNSWAKIKGDYLKMENLKKQYDLIIGNSPFNLAEKFIEKSIENIKEDGFVIMLLRLNFLGGKCRQKFWQKYNPYAVYVYNKRISFTENKKTDSIEYCHFVWKKSHLKDDTFKTKIIFEY